MTAPLPTALARYKNVQVTTCSPTELVVMLYDGVVRFTREAQQALKEGDRARAGERTSRAHAILEQLLVTLDRKHDPALAERLEGVYGFCMRRLMDANASKDAAAFDDVPRVLVPLRDAWADVARRAGKK